MCTAEPKVLGLIPARGGSKGIPGKNIRRLGDRPLIHYACEAALQSRRVSQVVVSTDCPRIADAARATGADVPFLRPPQLATDQTPMLDVIQHAVEWLAAHATQPDVIVLLQPTAPFRETRHIDEAVELLLNGPYDSVVSVTEVPRHYHPDWQFTVTHGQLNLVTGAPLSLIVSRRQDLRPTFVRNGAIYAFWRKVLAETGTLYGRDCGAYLMPAEQSINLDTLDDWQQAELTLNARGRKDAAA